MFVFTTTDFGDCCFLFSLHLKIFPFLVLEKRFLCFVVFASCCSTTSQCFFVGRPSPKKSTRFVVLSVVSRSPGKLFKRTLTYCGKRTQRYVKRERERERKKFLLRLTRVVVRTRGEKVARRRKEFSEQTTSA